MKEYFKILLSIIASLLILASIAAVIIGLVELFGGGKYQGMIFPFFIAAVGFIMFGIVGSGLWFAAFAVISRSKEYTFKLHVISASLATIISLLGVALWSSDFKSNAFVELLPLAIYVVPVVVGSLIVHKKYFSAKNT
jgi:hypothetical protein